MFCDCGELDVGIAELQKSRERFFSTLSYVRGVMDGHKCKKHNKHIGCPYPGYEEHYTDGVIVGMGMGFIEYIKFILDNGEYIYA